MKKAAMFFCVVVLASCSSHQTKTDAKAHAESTSIERHTRAPAAAGVLREKFDSKGSAVVFGEWAEKDVFRQCEIQFFPVKIQGTKTLIPRHQNPEPGSPNTFVATPEQLEKNKTVLDQLKADFLYYGNLIEKQSGTNIHIRKKVAQSQTSVAVYLNYFSNPGQGMENFDPVDIVAQYDKGYRQEIRDDGRRTRFSKQVRELCNSLR